jgi:moderate conductance mechanosensitive channel
MEGFVWGGILNVVWSIFLVLVAAWAALFILNKVIEHARESMLKKSERAGDPPSESGKRVDTLMRLVLQAGRVVLLVVVVLIILSELGLQIGPILASAGVVGLAIGFGAQALVRDLIAGFFFIMENQVRVGDVAVVNGTGGLVQEMNLRTLVLRDQSGTVHIFPNGTINTLSNMTNEWSAYVFDIGVAYKENTDRVVEVIRQVADGLKADGVFGPSIIEPVEIFGVDKFGDSAVVIKGRIKTKPIRQWVTGREFLRRIKIAFDEKGIEIPFPHRTHYFGQGGNPIDLRLFSTEAAAPVLKKSSQGLSNAQPET